MNKPRNGMPSFSNNTPYDLAVVLLKSANNGYLMSPKPPA